MRIEIITDTFDPDINGVAMTLGRLVAGLRGRGHIVHVTRSGPAEGDQSQTGAAFVRVPGYQEVRVGLPQPLKLKAKWRRKRPDVIYVATESPLGVSALKAAKKLGIPAVSGFHTNFHEYLQKYHLGRLHDAALGWLRSVHDLASLTLTPSPDAVRTLSEKGFKNVALLGRGVDTELFNPDKRSAALRQSWGARPGAPVVIVVGRVSGEKNLDLALECFQRLRAQVPDVQCVVVGDGPSRQRLQWQDPLIHFTGALEGKALATAYASADVLFFPSETETFGNVLLEGLASGLVTVSYDYAAAALHVEHSVNGFKAPKGDADRLISLAQSAMDLRGVSSLRNRAVRSVRGLSWESIIDHFEQHLQSVRQSDSRSRSRSNVRKKKRHYRSIFISDVHLGLPESKVTELVDFLKHTTCETLYLNGDIIDGWALKKGMKWSKRHTKLIRLILRKVEKENVKVYYLRGNHDEILDKVMPLEFGDLKVVKEIIHETPDGKRYLVIHGDGFDSVSTNHAWIASIGATTYNVLLKVNRLHNAYRSFIGKDDYSLSKVLKGKVKGVVSFIGKYEEQLQKLALSKGCDGIICGHIHTPEDKIIGSTHYLNCGDWVESLTAVVEDSSGALSVLSYEDFLITSESVEVSPSPSVDEDPSLPTLQP